MQRGEAMPQLDLEYAIKPLRANASEADVAEHERKCNIVAAYEQARLDALESSHRFGEALWDARIGSLEQILMQERNALKGTCRSTSILRSLTQSDRDATRNRRDQRRAQDCAAARRRASLCL